MNVQTVGGLGILLINGRKGWENDMGVITRDEVREILEEIIKDQSQINKAENTNDIESKPTATSSTEVPWWTKGE